MRILFSLITIFIIINLSVASAFAQATKWPTKKFKVEHGNPAAEDPSCGEIDEYKDQLVERYLERVSGTYLDKGFKAPQLPMKTIDAEKVYVVYLCDLPTGRVAAKTYPPGGDAPEGLMVFDRSKIYGSDRVELSPFGYSTIGHELFHAVQNSYAIKKSGLGIWIIEGTAQAVGMDMFFSLGPPEVVKAVKSDNRFDMLRRWGGRDYASALRVKHGSASKDYSEEEKKRFQNRGYQTSSLWRYIDEYIKAGGPPNLKPSSNPDYSYLVKFFEKPLPKTGTSEEKELAWLDQNLRNHPEIKIPLSTIYARHITDLAYYVPERAKDYPLHKIKYTTPEYIDKWLDYIFKPCKKVTLSDAKPSSKLTLSFAKVSARCIKVLYNGTEQNIGVGIYLKDQDAKKSVQTIGVLNRKTSSSPQMEILYARGCRSVVNKRPSEWIFPDISFSQHPITKTRSNIFIVSNIACDAAKTEAFDSVSFEVSYALSKGTFNKSKTGK